MVYGEDIRVVDESTLLKFFIDPEVNVLSLNDNKVLN